MAELHLIRLRHFGVFRFGNGLFLQNAVDTRHAFVDLLGVSAQERQFVDGRSHTRSHDDEKQPYGGQCERLRIPLYQQDTHGKNERHHRTQQDGERDHPVLVGVAAFQGECLVSLYLGVELPERADALSEYLHHGHSPDVLHGGGAHLFLRIIVNTHELPCLLPHEIGELQGEAQQHHGQTDRRQPCIQREKDDEHHHDRRHYVHQIGNRVGDESLDFLDVLLHRLLDGSGRGVVEITQRQFADMLGQPDTQSVQNAECSHVRGHQGGVQQHQSADKPAEGDPAPTNHAGFVHRSRACTVRQQLFQHLVHRPIGYEHTHGAACRQQTRQKKQPFLLPRDLEQAGQTFFLLFFCFHILNFIRFSLSVVGKFL